MSGYDGPTLRAVRESLGMTLRRIARQANLSHGHLSKVERGEHGRPVTPAVVAAYERATEMRLGEAAAGLARQEEGLLGAPRRQTWTAGELSDARRRGFNAAIAALTLGGPLGEPLTRLLDATGRPTAPRPPDLGDVAQLEQMAHLFTTLDLRFGGGMMSQVVKHVLRWAVGMMDVTLAAPVPVGRRLHAAVGAVAARAAWAAFDVDGHEAARSLFRLALYAAARAGEPNLRAHVLAEVAAQHNHLGYHGDALEIVRFGEGDERVDPPVRMVLHGAKARAYGALGEVDNCRRQVELAEQAHTTDDGGGWLATVATPARMFATTGHAIAALATCPTLPEVHRRDYVADAMARLDKAVDLLDPVSHARARTLCTATLATLHLDTGDQKQGANLARGVLRDAPQIHSSRLVRALGRIRATTADEPALHELTADLDAYFAVEHDPHDPGRRNDG